MSERDPEQRTVPPDGRPAEQQPAWRKDFPVDWPQDQYVARREFTKFMVLTSLAFVVGQVCIGIGNWFRRRRPAPERKPIARLEEIKPGGVVSFNYPGEHDPCLLVRTRETPTGQKVPLLAYDQRCTHLSCGVVPHLEDEEKRHLALGECRLLCPCHHGFFDLENGRPIAGPPRRPLTRITLEVEKGVVYATGVEERTV